jgi:hypothetical protein
VAGSYACGNEPSGSIERGEFLASLLAAVAQLVEALRYKPEGRGFDSRWCHWNSLLT